MLEVRLIGTFALKCDGNPVTISSRASQSLFAYLILTAGTMHRREKLAGMFWPDTSEEKARAYLRHELWLIRKALPSKSKSDYLIADDVNISFNASAEYWLDITALTDASEGASAEELMKALSVYQGELLPGFYDDWLTQEREHLPAIYEQKMARLLDLLEGEKRWHEILEWAERWISLGQAPEAAYRYLMIAYDALGDRARVASTYQRCVQALRTLDLEPSEQTRALAFKWTSKLNIPIPLTSFIGREKELKEVANLFSKSRLVTLTGAGGVGKTRLAIQVVAEILDMFPDGVWFLDLAPLSDPTLMPNTLANLLGLREPRDTKLSVTDILINYLRFRIALVIFDNCEHLIESCSQLVHSLLTTCENLSILATSREVLRVSGEISYRVPSLDIPKSEVQFVVNDLAAMESVRLFTERAAFVSPGFALNSQNARDIAQICRHLDGIPLAIELAAARVQLLTVEEISKRLYDSFRLLTSGARTALPRHQTLRAAIDWSYDLLTKQEKLMITRLAVFAGGWTLEAAEAVCVENGVNGYDILDLLARLVNKSLVLVVERALGDEVRYRMLETIRQYARARLIKSGEEENIRTRHLKYFLQLSEQAEPTRGFVQAEWYTRYNAERDNIRIALDWADQADVETGLYLSGRLDFFWGNFDLNEAADWLVKFLHKRESNGFPVARAKALCTWAWLLYGTQEFDLSQNAAQEALDLYKACGDIFGEIEALLALGGKEHYQQAFDLSKSLGDPWKQAQILVWLGWSDNDYHRRITYMEEAIELFQKLGDWEASIGHMIWLGNLEIANGDFQSAQKWRDEAMKIGHNLTNMGLKAHILSLFGNMALIEGDYVKARTDFNQVATIWEGLGHRWPLAWTHVRLGYVALRQGELTEAHHILAEAAQIFQKDQYIEGVVSALEGIASLCVEVDQPERASRLIGWADVTREHIPNTRPSFEQSDVDHDITVVIAKMGEVAFSDAYEKGKKMTLDEAVDVALKKLR